MKNCVKALQVIPLFLVSAISFAQDIDYNQTKEKLYVHTNHVFFKPGEHLYMKIYAVMGRDQSPSLLSKIVYIDIISPSGSVFTRLKYPLENGYAEGSYGFNQQTPGGIYKIRAYTTWMKNEDESLFFEKELTIFKAIAPRVLMKLDFPTKGYGPGDTVEAEFSMRNLEDQPVRHQEGQYTVSLGGTATESKTFTTGPDGKAKIRFKLPDNLKTNDGLLNITVRYRSYTESVSRSIPITLNDLDLQFLPEGGAMVNGICSNVAFKGLNESGKPVDIAGEIRDQDGNRIAIFESYHGGMGSFSFTPLKGKIYTARVTRPAGIHSEYPLPAARDHGIVLNMSRIEKRILIRLASKDTVAVIVAGRMKGIQYFSREVVFSGEKLIEASEDDFPMGIAQFTVLAGEQLRPLAERLIFLNRDRQLRVEITANKKQYLPREKVTLTVKTSDEAGHPVPSNLSLAVIDDKLWSFADDRQNHIISWLMMSSELRGKVEEPQFYFKKDEPRSAPALDLVMMTHGYRYFDLIPAVVREGKLQFLPEGGSILNGRVVNSGNQPLKALVFLLEASSTRRARKIETSDSGLFHFTGLNPGRQYYLIAQPVNPKEAATIRILQNGLGYNIMLPVPYRPLSAENISVPAIRMKIPEVAVKKDLVMKPTAGDALQEVVVTGVFRTKRSHYAGAAVTLSQEELQFQNNINQVLAGKVAGVTYIAHANPGSSGTIRLRGSSVSGSSTPLIIVNGVPVEGLQLKQINPANIHYIEVLKDSEAVSLYGCRAAGGVILINLKQAVNSRIRINTGRHYPLALMHITAQNPDFDIPSRFYTPRYTSLETDERNDFRETIYWNPVIHTDKNGTAQISFPNSDASTTFRVIAEGIAFNGLPGRNEFTYAAAAALTADVKIPPYLTAGDKAILPLVIRNNQETDLPVHISLVLPPGLEAGEFMESLLLVPGASRQVLIPVTALKAMTGTIRFRITSPAGNETIAYPVSAENRGFPVVETFSGNTSASHEIRIRQMETGTLNCSLQLFRNLEGQLLDGIESMLREPHGCFEQTSSTTYPNVFILKFLRESGRANATTDRKAMEYIRKGYHRLVSFETAQGGFEWFGNTPPHEALTAYGLLEFTDMKEFIPVDEQMLLRTRNFLLGRRDGRGGFNIVSGGYDRFASVPGHIANFYIIYALTQAGITREIRPEYESAVKKAMQSKDGYQMAMMAIAADNMKNIADFRLLMEMLREQHHTNGLSAETSVVNSRANSLRVETLSLYALALLREKEPDMILIAGILSDIMSRKNHYGYGSTQATVLALQAITEYTRRINRSSGENDPTFTINNTIVSERSVSASLLREGSNAFQVQYDGGPGIPYQLQISYQSILPMDSEKSELELSTSLATSETTVGETVRMAIKITNRKNWLQPMAVAKIGVPAGLSVQTWQLKELMEKEKVAYYEFFDNFLVLYWMGFAANEAKEVALDLKADIPGSYTGRSGNVYLYYTPEFRHWNAGLEMLIHPAE